MPVPADAPDPRLIRALAERIFQPARQLAVERVPEGGSTFVYRVVRSIETFYLRVLPEIGDSFAPEVHAHELLRARGVLVPEVVYFEHLHPELGYSVMATTEISGSPVASRPVDAATHDIMFAAGQQLAILNTIHVAGFGWIKRDSASVVALEADHPTLRAFVHEHLARDLAALEAHGLLTPAAVAAICRLADVGDGWRDTGQATLAHGDFDLMHIFHQDGRYSGLIDFGEIRGTDPWYDLGYFWMHDGERQPTLLLPWLLAGYESVCPLPADALRYIRRASVLIALRAWARSLERRPADALRHRARTSIRRDLELLRG